jgi:DNA-binding NarL/FixJ family response regulator
MDEKRRIVLAEDHAVVREGLRVLLASHPDLEVVGEAGDGYEAIQCVENLRPDLVLMDLSMPRENGMQAIREIKRRFPETKILALTVHDSEEYVIVALKAGAYGYILKKATHAELLMAIKSILAGEPYLSPGISDKVIKGYLKGKKTHRDTTSWDMLTSREMEVLKLIAGGYKSKEIAEQLFISVNTVEKHRNNIMKKLDLHSASALTAFAIKKGLVTK